MMLSRPVLLGYICSFLVLTTSGQSPISNNESNKVYAYSYHFQHNGTTNSKEILRSVLGNDPDFGLDNPDEKSIVKTFSSPGIRGFFTKGILPAGPVSQTFSNGVQSPYTAIKKIVESNLQPPHDVATRLLPPISPDISREFPGNFNNVNHLGNVFRNDFEKVPPSPVIPNNIGNRNVENFARDTPNGGRVVGRVETFSYNSPPDSNSIARTEENSEGYRRNENILNSNREVTGHRTQSFYRTHFRTVTPNLKSNSYNENSRVGSSNTAINDNNNNNNQWWNVLNVLGNRNNNLNPTTPQLNKDINQNMKEIQQINRAFGARLSAFRRQNELTSNNRQNNFGRQNNDNNYNQNRNFNNPITNQNFNNPLVNQNFNPLANHNVNKPLHNNRGIPNIPFRGFNNPPVNNPVNIIPNHRTINNALNSNLNINHNNNRNVNRHSPNIPHNTNPNINSQPNEDTEKKVLNLIHDVNAHLKDLNNNNERINNIAPSWEDIAKNNHNDWSTRRRPFSNGHSGPSNGPQSMNILKTTLNALVGSRNIDIPRNHGNNYRNVDGGGVEKFFGVDKMVEGPNSFSRNQQRGYERNFQVNSNSGYSRSNQWSTNAVRRLDAQSSKPDFSTDFIDVFRDDY